ncbi:hypothetical protein B0T20DRAFT_488051 [Sordaria brevicollis]|uniref:Protein kish n=1 Tax=Sordaria brevicollis TaxID=83679 RepID=A0AAE0P2Z5_SORBR|nr:hypothetical protein B0T20DRAFT_488051 [Sordaria brevicollis]
MTALFNFQSLLLVIILLVCTSTYVHQIFPAILDRNKDGIMGIFWKCARIGERLSPYVSICCILMATGESGSRDRTTTTRGSDLVRTERGVQESKGLRIRRTHQQLSRATLNNTRTTMETRTKRAEGHRHSSRLSTPGTRDIRPIPLGKGRSSGSLWDLEAVCTISTFWTPLSH